MPIFPLRTATFAFLLEDVVGAMVPPLLERACKVLQNGLK